MTSVLFTSTALLLGVALSAQTPSQERAPYRASDGVVLPTVVSDVKPNYTVDAMRARVQGAIKLECVVTADGTVRDIKVLESLPHGLDDSAIAALKQWRFKPGTLNGEAVPVIVDVEMTFALGRRGPALDSPEVYSIGVEGVTAPVVLKETKPQYPEAIRAQGITGSIILQTVVLADGTVGDTRVTRSLDSRLDAEAIRALNEWRFSPAMKDGRAVPARVSVEMTFSVK
jgi:TonB family protein